MNIQLKSQQAHRLILKNPTKKVRLESESKQLELENSRLNMKQRKEGREKAGKSEREGGRKTKKQRQIEGQAYMIRRRPV